MKNNENNLIRCLINFLLVITQNNSPATHYFFFQSDTIEINSNKDIHQVHFILAIDIII